MSYARPTLKQGMHESDLTAKEIQFIQNKAMFRKQMLNIVKFLQESHLIFCKFILVQIKHKGVQLQNKYVVQLDSVVDEHFDLERPGSIGQTLLKKKLSKTPHTHSNQSVESIASDYEFKQDFRLQQENITYIFSSSKYPLVFIRENNTTPRFSPANNHSGVVTNVQTSRPPAWASLTASMICLMA